MIESAIASPVALLARADLILLVTDLLRSPARGGWPRQPMPAPPELTALVAAAEFHVPTDELTAALLDALDEASQIPLEGVSDEHHRLFEGAMPCPLNETAYIRRDKGAIIGDLAGFYRAFGFAPDAGSGEKADHLLTELEFVAVLFILCAQAPAEQQRNIAHDALAAFAAAHLGDWLPAACQQLAQLTRLQLFQHASSALNHIWQCLVLSHQWPITPAIDGLAGPDDPADSPYECGAGDAEPIVSLHVHGRPASHTTD